MAARANVVVVHVEHVDHDTGHWCNTCLLSTGIRLWVAATCGGRMRLHTCLHCYDCGGSDITLAED